MSNHRVKDRLTTFAALAALAAALAAPAQAEELSPDPLSTIAGYPAS